MADVKLYNQNGVPVTYNGITSVFLVGADGGSVEFTLSGSGGNAAPFSINVGDSLSKIYFNQSYFSGYTGDTKQATILSAYLDANNHMEIVWNHYGDTNDNTIIATITQNGEAKTISIFDGIYWQIGCLDLTGYQLGTVQSLDINAPLMMANDAVTFGRPTPLPPYLVAPGDTVNVLHFNPLSADAVSQTLPILYEVYHKDGDVEPSFGVSYADIGLSLRVGSLSSVGLGTGYLLYSAQTFLPVFSTIAFDASSIVPGFVVTTPGWQVEYLEYTTPITANYDEIAPLLLTNGIMHMVWAKTPFSVDLSSIMT